MSLKDIFTTAKQEKTNGGGPLTVDFNQAKIPWASANLSGGSIAGADFSGTDITGADMRSPEQRAQKTSAGRLAQIRASARRNG